MVGIVVAEYAPFAISRKAVPPFPSFAVAIVVRKILHLAVRRGAVLQIVRVVVCPRPVGVVVISHLGL